MLIDKWLDSRSKKMQEQHSEQDEPSLQNSDRAGSSSWPVEGTRRKSVDKNITPMRKARRRSTGKLRGALDGMTKVFGLGRQSYSAPDSRNKLKSLTSWRQTKRCSAKQKLAIMLLSFRSTRHVTGTVCPPPYTNEEWKKFSKNRIGRYARNHTDGCPAHRRPSGFAHDAVCHGYKKGKGQEFVKKTTHVKKHGKPVTAYGGTQCFDGWWTTAKRQTHGVNARFKDKVSAKVRFAQFLHWIVGRDRCWLLLLLRREGFG